MDYQYIFGPVPSRRLGTSLGIDLIPYKTCSLNCVYCECGQTTNLTLTREEYVPTDIVLEELDDYLKTEPELDYITFSGSGEPTLHTGIGKIINFLKTNYPRYQLALLTNSTLFNDQQLQDEIKDLNLIVPSLDAVSEDVFQKLNRPVAGITADELVQGLINLKNFYDGDIWLEIFVVPKVNDTEREMKKFKEVVDQIDPDKIQINSLDRPGTEEWVKRARDHKLIELVSILGNRAEIVTAFNSHKTADGFQEKTGNYIMELLKRRPCTVQDISTMLDMNINEVNKYIRILEQDGRVKVREGERGHFYYVEN